MLGILALMSASLFAGAAIYISVAEHPARMQLDPAAALKQWKPAYEKAATVQATYALVGSLAGVGQYIGHGQWLCLLGAALLFANWPYTFLVIMPTNKKLQAQDKADDTTMQLLQRWGALHWWRGLLGFASALMFAIAACWSVVGYAP